jgi:hypothetical protein
MCHFAQGRKGPENGRFHETFEVMGGSNRSMVCVRVVKIGSVVSASVGNMISNENPTRRSRGASASTPTLVSKR